MDNGKEFTIGEMAKKAGVNIQTIRYYEREGLLKPHSRKISGYRLYNTDNLKRLIFILHAKELGFSLKEISDLLELRIISPKTQTCNLVRKKAQEKLKNIQEKISQLKRLEKTLKQLIGNCENRVVSDQCPILEKMEV